MSDNPITGEVSNSKLAAVFPAQAPAQAAAADLVEQLGFQPAQVKLLTPDTADVDIKLEPEGGGIWRTIVLAHLKLCVLGALAGAAIFAAMLLAGIPFVENSPWTAGGWWVLYGAIGGLFLGGLVALRPDHDRYIQAARKAVAAGRSAVVVHALSMTQQQQAARFLAERGADVTRTL
ncbi:hypothetical protein CQ393_15110 [Stenotrophomonas sp. MYb238]|uniref:hypothetical protein n=1 Tax=Stenotrophomonas sp. MYb238 TaxID=2040281 RepID=UPI0012910645|nr:hypothetical protein [Stenotrophomonas sp. MYb238]MQP77210.1 hypothetical protein [Stenotrophomonas sp. MYb238]